jgi:Zn-dependent metalloprotease
VHKPFSPSHHNPSFTQRNGMSILTFHSEDGNMKYDQLTQALKEVNASQIAKEADEMARKPGKVKKSGKTGVTDDLVHKFKEVAQCLLIDVLGWEVESRRGFVQSDSSSSQISTLETKLESVAIETWRLANTHTIKFHQKYKDVPVYGAQVNVEIDEENELIAINSAIGVPIGIDENPKIKSDELKDLIQKITKHGLKKSVLKSTLYYYFDSTQTQERENKLQDGQWRLVYLVENQIDKTNDTQMFESIHEMVDYVIDAHTGKLVSELPCVKTIR